MSVECSECESDARAGHDPDCSRSAEGEVRRLQAVIRKHYPTIAGHVLRLQEGHETRAATEWEAVAHDFARAIGL